MSVGGHALSTICGGAAPVGDTLHSSRNFLYSDNARAVNAVVQFCKEVVFGAKESVAVPSSKVKCRSLFQRV